MENTKSIPEILQDFGKRVTHKVDDIIQQAVNEDGIQIINISDFAEELDNDLNISELVSAIISARAEVLKYEENQNEVTILLHPSVYKSDENQEYEKKYSDEDFTDIEIMCAKHVLWIYGNDDDEQADFSNSMVTNISFDEKNLCGANFSNALFINCSFKNTSLCTADFSNSTFIDCNFKDMVAEGSNQIGTKYINCNLTNAYFTGSNFKNAEMINTEMEKTSLMNCCLESIIVKGSTFSRANTLNVCYDELEWNEEGAGQDMEIGGM